MTIKDVEERTGLSRSNIRFYEKEKLIEPSRNESNGYRDYSENDVENIKKIAYLRTLGISIEDIRSIISEKVTLQEMLEKQKEVLKNQITDLNKAKLMCEKMLDEESISYEKLQVEQYVTDLHDYWKDWGCGEWCGMDRTGCKAACHLFYCRKIGYSSKQE